MVHTLRLTELPMTCGQIFKQVSLRGECFHGSRTLTQPPHAGLSRSHLTFRDLHRTHAGLRGIGGASAVADSMPGFEQQNSTSYYGLEAVRRVDASSLSVASAASRASRKERWDRGCHHSLSSSLDGIFMHWLKSVGRPSLYGIVSRDLLVTQAQAEHRALSYMHHCIAGAYAIN